MDAVPRQCRAGARSLSAACCAAQSQRRTQIDGSLGEIAQKYGPEARNRIAALVSSSGASQRAARAFGIVHRFEHGAQVRTTAELAERAAHRQGARAWPVEYEKYVVQPVTDGSSDHVHDDAAIDVQLLVAALDQDALVRDQVARVLR